MPPALTAQRLSTLLQPYVSGLALPEGMYERCAEYLHLLLRWNSRTNLTAVRDPEELATRQLGESLFSAHLVEDQRTLLDFGSGAGFPGIPLQLARPSLTVTLAESQGKKASFLREAIRVLELPAEVWAARVETMPHLRRFDVVAMRAVDRSLDMAKAAAERVADSGSWLRFRPGTDSTGPEQGWALHRELAIPGSQGRLQKLVRTAVFHVEHDQQPRPGDR